MRLTIAFAAGVLAGVGLTFGAAFLAGRDAERRMMAAGG